MPEHFEDPHQIISWIYAKKRNEFELAKRILIEFNKPDLLEPLLGWVEQAIQEMDEVRRVDLEGQRLVSRAWNSERSHLETLKTYGSLSALLGNVQSLKAEQCGDIIRLYSKFIDIGAKKYLQKRDAYDFPKRPQYLPFDPGVTKPYLSLAKEQSALRKDKEEIWSTEKKDYARARVKTAKVEGPLLPPGKARKLFLGLKGGINRWTLTERSTVLKMDRIFGLPLGADISGTTVGTIAFLRDFVQSDVNPLYFLLPIATIVAKGHHTILEAALPLTHNFESTGVEYSIGFYTTLMSEYAYGPEATALINVLRQYQDDLRNRLMLIHYTGPDRVGGCYVYSDLADRQHFQSHAIPNYLLMMRVRTFASPWVSKKDVEDLQLSFMPR